MTFGWVVLRFTILIGLDGMATLCTELSFVLVVAAQLRAPTPRY